MTGGVTAVVLLLGLTEDEADFSDSGEIKRLALIGSRTDLELNGQGHKEERLGSAVASVLSTSQLVFPHQALSAGVRSCPSFLPRTTEEALLYN